MMVIRIHRVTYSDNRESVYITNYSSYINLEKKIHVKVLINLSIHRSNLGFELIMKKKKKKLYQFRRVNCISSICMYRFRTWR